MQEFSTIVENFPCKFHVTKEYSQMKFIKKMLNFIRGEQPLDKLISRGLKIGKNFTRMSGVIIDPSHCWHIEIGDDVILAPRVHLLAHDAGTKLFLNYTRVSNVKIGNKVFIGAGSIVLPGVTIGDNVVIGAGSIVSKDIPSNSLAVGSPAKVICSLEEYLQKKRNNMNELNTFDSSYTLRNTNFNKAQKLKMLEVSIKYRELFVE